MIHNSKGKNIMKNTNNAQDIEQLEDMLASIGDYISDDETLLNTVCKYLHLNHITLGNEYSFYEKAGIVMELINGFNYEQLDKVITDLNISYE